MSPSPQEQGMDRKLLWILAIASAISAGNLYYAQPLLGDMARTFNVGSVEIARIPVLTQMGYVLGLLLLTPLGDLFENRKLILGSLIFQALAVFGAGIANRLPIFEFMAFTIGVSSVMVQVIVPLVGKLSPRSHRSRDLGILVGAALIGILLARAFSGIIAAHTSWRTVYFLASGLLLTLYVALFLVLPRHEPLLKITYRELLLSLGHMFRTLPALRTIAVNGALLYAALSCFWASLIFFLESDTHHLGTQTAGFFGFAGALGAMSASQIGRIIESKGSRWAIRFCMSMMALSFAIMGFFGVSLIALVIGVIVLDIGAQGGTVTNQSELYNIHAGAPARLNTIYKVIYFLGGAAGSAVSALAWQLYGWPGVCAAGFLFVTAAAIWDHLLGNRT